MGRIVFELSGFFFLPFLCYAAFLVWQERHPRAAMAILTRRALQVQALAGLILVAAMLLIFGLSDQKKTGAYVPAVVRDGQLIPGRVE
jgi:hypothetical protein